METNLIELKEKLKDDIKYYDTAINAIELEHMNSGMDNMVLMNKFIMTGYRDYAKRILFIIDHARGKMTGKKNA